MLQVRKKDQINIESKMKTVRFIGKFTSIARSWLRVCMFPYDFQLTEIEIYKLFTFAGELVKFKMFPKQEALHCLKV